MKQSVREDIQSSSISSTEICDIYTGTDGLNIEMKRVGWTWEWDRKVKT